MKQFFIMAIAGVVAAAVWQKINDNQQPRSLALVYNGIPGFNPRPVPSGHGDATGNVTGSMYSKVDNVYSPPLTDGDLGVVI